MIAGHSLTHLLWPPLVPIHSFPKLCLMPTSYQRRFQAIAGEQDRFPFPRKPSIPVGQESRRLAQTGRLVHVESTYSKRKV